MSQTATEPTRTQEEEHREEGDAQDQGSPKGKGKERDPDLLPLFPGRIQAHFNRGNSVAREWGISLQRDEHAPLLHPYTDAGAGHQIRIPPSEVSATFNRHLFIQASDESNDMFI